MLYIVGTPIGNLDDLSFRQAKTLLSSDIILAEDTRSAHNLLSKIPQLFPNLPNIPNIPNRPNIISYYKQKEFEKLPEILDLLKQGKNISLVSKSGMPLINDPGYLLVKTCIKQNIPFTVIPGSSAIITALVYSGFNPNNFMFLGFLPKNQTKVIQCFETLYKIQKILPKTIFIFYESPLRINKTLEILNKILPETNVCICRELTKKFEEILRDKPRDLINKHYKGEITLILNFL